MHIVDNHGEKHLVHIGTAIAVDGHAISRGTRSHNVVTYERYRIPTHLQSRGIGSALLHAIEKRLRVMEVAEVRFVIPFAECPQYEAFFIKHHYKQDGDVWSKKL